MTARPIVFDGWPRQAKRKRERPCRQCGETFTTPRGHPEQTFCSRDCSGRWNVLHRKPKPGRRYTCLVCEREFRPSWKGRKTCSKECAHIRGRPRTKMAVYQKRPKDMLPDLGPPRCPTCNRLDVKLGSDPRNGVSILWCPSCGEMPLPRYGVVKYDQRTVLDDELGAHIKRAQSKVDPKFQHDRTAKQLDDARRLLVGACDPANREDAA